MRTKVTEGRGKCGVPGIFLTGLRQVWLLSRGPSTEVRPPPEPVPDVSRTSRPGRLIAVTASQDRDETPRTPLGLPHRPGTTRGDARPTSLSWNTVRPMTA